MILCLDVGNSQIYGGVFSGPRLLLSFRQNSRSSASSDEYGLFLRAVLRENGFDPQRIERVALCTVVPELLHSMRNCCLKYFNTPPFVLQAGVKTGLKIKYRNPLEVGADRIADALGATEMFPDENIVIVDFGTATTVSVTNRDKEFLGGAILPGLRISMEALEQKTSRLPTVEIVPIREVVGRSTVESIQSGLYFGAIGSVRELLRLIAQEAFAGERPRVIGTGGFASLFANAELYDKEVPDLVLRGLYKALMMNVEGEKDVKG
jgi:type III pantothenate kinase